MVKDHAPSYNMRHNMSHLHLIAAAARTLAEPLSTAAKGPPKHSDEVTSTDTSPRKGSQRIISISPLCSISVDPDLHIDIQIHRSKRTTGTLWIED